MELAFVFVDLGKPFYRGAVRLMVDSARLAMPDARIVQLSDKSTRAYPGVDGIATADIDCTTETICKLKGQMFADRALTADDNTVLCDIDLIWNRSPEEIFERHFDVAVMWRRETLLQPYNSGVIFTKPTPAARLFWSAYARCMLELPPSLAMWFGDQVALASLIGPSAPGNVLTRSGAKVLILDMDEIARAPKTEPRETTDSYCAHFKGLKRRAWMAPYAEYLHRLRPPAGDSVQRPAVLDSAAHVAAGGDLPAGAGNAAD